MPDIYINKENKTESKKQKAEMKTTPEADSVNPGKHHNITGHTHNPLASFFRWPDNVNFETQEKEEKVVLMLRKHPITNIPWIIVAIILLFAPNVLSFFPLLDFLPFRFQLIALFFWYLIVTAFIIEEALSWLFNVYILTDERVVDIDFYNLIYKEISDTKIDKIQDVTYNVGGVVRTLFNYGDVLIQTAGTVPNFEFQAVPNPAEVARILQEMRTEEEREQLEGRIR